MSGQLIIDLSDTPTVAACTLGALHIDERGRFWEYVHASGAITAGATVVIDQDGEAAAITTTNAGSVGQKAGIADVAFADNDYGWVWRGNGNFEAVIANAHSAGALLTTTGNAGEPGASGVALDGLRAIDAGVTATRVTVHAPGLLTVGVAAASD